MRKHLIVVMDDIAAINVKKDSSFAMLLAAQRRGYQTFYTNETGLFLHGAEAGAHLLPITVRDQAIDWFELGEAIRRPFSGEDVIIMRADPPVDADYIHATYLLDRAEAAGALVINRPSSLREFNEKLAIARFPDLIPETLVSSRHADLRAFVKAQGQAVLKPLDGMGGRGIFLARAGDSNLNAMMEALTGGEQRPAMAQAFLPEIADGDKRVLMIQGEPVPYMLARVPGSEDFRGNLARGGRGEPRPITEVERHIATVVGPTLVEHGIAFAGLDVIGDRLTEINHTSPTCIRELDAAFGLDIATDLLVAVDP
jgi:glutathione synthase